MLRVCQRLNEEAEYILYRTNTLLLYFDSQTWTMLNARCRVSGSITELAASLHKPYTDLKSIAKEVATNDTLDSEAAQRLVLLYDTLSKFENLKLAVSICTQEELFISCLAIQDFVQGKNITFEPMEYAKRLCARPDWLKSCSNLRCRSIVFENIPELISAPVVSIVTSNTHVQDLFRVWAEFMNEVIARMLRLNPDSQNKYKRKARDLKTAMNHDATALYNSRAKILAGISQEYEKLIDNEQNSLQRQYDKEIAIKTKELQSQMSSLEEARFEISKTVADIFGSRTTNDKKPAKRQ